MRAVTVTLAPLIGSYFFTQYLLYHAPGLGAFILPMVPPNPLKCSPPLLRVRYSPTFVSIAFRRPFRWVLVTLLDVGNYLFSPFPPVTLLTKSTPRTLLNLVPPLRSFRPA